MPNIEVSDSAFAFLQSRAKPLIDTAASALDALISEFRALSEAKESCAPKGLVLGLDHVPSLKFTSVVSAKVDGKPARHAYWNNILEDVIRACVARGGSPEEIARLLVARTKSGTWSDGGYRPVKEAGFSFQGIEANRAFKSIVNLARAHSVSLEIEVRWPDKEDAALPNQTGKIVHP